MPATQRALTGYAVGALALLGLMFCFVFTTTAATKPLATLGGGTMGTFWRLQYWREGGVDASLDAVLVAELARLDRSVFSTYAPDSELSRLNGNPAVDAVTLSPDLFAVLQMAQAVYAHSDHAFDPTVGPLVRLWGFGPDAVDEDTVPAAADIAAARAKLGMSAVQLQAQSRSVIRAQAVELDLSAIAKGYAADVLATLLQRRGINDYLLDVGSEVRVAGRKPDGSSWRIAIEKPENTAPSAFAVLDTQGETLAVSSSGDYRTYREIGGKRYSHEIDPRSGWPIDHALTAVTVVADTAALADAWATALLVLGPHQGLRLADDLGLSAYFIIHTNHGVEAKTSQRFKERFSGLDYL
ncbi:MAG: FAD:protein FMN transferase [Pseudomonadales bacterium]|jgi:thiamine biosynthesis lipoprotein|nr:FAD:protein FMN transferase [Pseudomonadales bacterium]